MLAGSALAGHRAAIVTHLIQSARLNGHEPYTHLSDALECVPLMPENLISELLPHPWKSAIVILVH
jgi:hypothetical protein